MQIPMQNSVIQTSTNTPSGDPRDNSNFLSIGDGANYLGVSIDTIRRWEKKGRLQAHRSEGGHRYFTKEDLDSVKGKRYKREKSELKKPEPKFTQKPPQFQTSKSIENTNKLPSFTDQKLDVINPLAGILKTHSFEDDGFDTKSHFAAPRPKLSIGTPTSQPLSQFNSSQTSFPSPFAAISDEPPPSITTSAPVAPAPVLANPLPLKASLSAEQEQKLKAILAIDKDEDDSSFKTIRTIGLIIILISLVVDGVLGFMLLTSGGVVSPVP